MNLAWRFFSAVRILPRVLQPSGLNHVSRLPGIWGQIAALVACGLSLLSICTLNASPIVRAWPMFQGNPAHTGYVPGTFDLTSFALRWQTNVPGGLSLNPVSAGEGKVFVSQLEYFVSAGLYAFDAANGNLLWSVPYGGVFSVNPPSYSSGKVFVQTGKHVGAEDAALHVYYATNGALFFQAPFDAQWERYYAPTIYAGNIYIDGGYYGGMYGIDGKSALRLWFAYLNQYDEWTPAVDSKYAYAYTGEYNPNLSVIHRTTGAVAFSIPDSQFQWNGWSMDLAPVLGTNKDVLAIHDGRLICFNVAATNISWQIKDGFQGQPSVAKGVIYAIDAGVLAARDELTGALLWEWATNSYLAGTMIVTDSHVLVGSGDAIYAVNLATHFSEWSYPVSGSLALSEGVLYVAGSDGTLTAITAPSSYSATNQPPVCIIGGPYRALCNNTTATVQLDGSDSYDANDPQGGILTYSWSTDCPGGSFDDPTSPTPILTLSCSITQAFTVTLVVSDGQQTSSNQTAVTVNHAPVCIIGGPYQAECNGSATTVQLDGSGSYDPDGGALTYKWTTACPGGSFDDPTSPTPILTMDCTATQACWVVLVVSNGQQTSFSLASVTVGDTLPPSLSRLAAKPATLWPPSHQLVPVAIQGAAIDACDPAPTFKIISISSSDAPMSKPPLTFPVGPSFPERPPAPMLPNSSSISDYKITGAHTLMLRADCANPRVGRTYTITVQGKDEAGNTSTRKLVVKVPAATK